MIEGVITKELTVHADERGYVMEILRADDPIFSRFGQAYVTACYPGVVKAWHGHRRQTDYLCCIAGMAKVALYDRRDDSPTRGELSVYTIGRLCPTVIVIPPGVYHGFTAVGPETALILNCPTEPYKRQEPDELRLPYDTPEIPYDWSVKHG
jgi:dTDP-4-dehydrorhamnose 3,5-epimerase